MDKYEFNIKVDQLKKLVNTGDYGTAIKIADTIDWKRVRNTNLLSMVASVYEKNEEYQEAKEILLMAFERAPIGKRLLYKLAELALKEGNVEEAEAYYREFCDLAPDDPRQNLLRYLILREKGAPVQQLIHSLESYTSEELEEKWLYELADLYHQAGMGKQCVQICDKIMLMFGLGKYVDKAMELKVQYAPLTSYQMDLVENRGKYEAKLRAVERGHYKEVPEVAEPLEDYDEDMEDMRGQEIPIDHGMSPGIYDDDLAARLKEAEVEENLAREMSKFSGNQEIGEPSLMERTRVLENIRSINPGMRPEEDPMTSPEPVIEEVPAGFGDMPYAAQDSVYEAAAYNGEYAAETGYGFQDQGEAAYQEDFHGDPAYEEAGDEGLAAYSDEESAYAQAETAASNVVPFKPVGDMMEEEPEPASVMTNHLMIEAVTPEIGLEIAVETLKRIHLETGLQNPVIKITGDKLARRGVYASAAKLAGKDLIVENAGDLTEAALSELEVLMDQDTTGMIVVLIDDPQQMETIHRNHPALARKFECIGSEGEEDEDFDEVDVEAVEAAISRQATAQEAIAREVVTQESQEPAGEDKTFSQEDERPVRMIERERKPRAIPSAAPEEAPEPELGEPEYAADEEMDIDEFAQYACQYANEIDCSITGKSMLALYERIEIMEEDGVPLTREEAENLIEEAADKAEKPSLGKLIKGVFSSKYDKDGMLILKEEHFID